MPTANIGDANAGDPVAKTNVEYGEFPFPLTDGAEESRYLTWLRNHSNYMAVHGILDYLRSAGVLVRGIVVNFLIFLPFLLLIALGLSWTHHAMLLHPFYVTLRVLALSVGWILLFPIVTQLFKIFSYSKSVETGTESSVKQRDLYELSFGAALLIISAVGLFELLPWVLEYSHDLIHSENFGWQGSVATVTAALAMLSGAAKLLSSLRGMIKRVAMVLVGLLGLLVPLLVILYATDFLVYAVPPRPSRMFSPLVVPTFVGVIAIMIAIWLGLWRSAFNRTEKLWVGGLLVAGFMLIALVVAGGSWATFKNYESTEESLERIIDPLDRVAEEFATISDATVLHPEVKELVDQVVSVHGSYQRTIEDQKSPKLHLGPANSEISNPPVGDMPSAGAEKTDFNKKSRVPKTSRSDSPAPESGKESFWEWWNALYAKWMGLEGATKKQGERFLSGRQFIRLGNKLSAQPPGRLEPLRSAIAKSAREKLLDRLEHEFRNADGLGDSPEQVRTHLAKQLRSKLTDQFVEAAVDRLAGDSYADTSEDLVFENDWGVDEEAGASDRRDREERALDHTAWGYWRAVGRFVERTQMLGITPSYALDSAPTYAETQLPEQTEELARLVDEGRLGTIFPTSGIQREIKVELAKLTGNREIAELIRKEEVVWLVLEELRNSTPTAIYVAKSDFPNSEPTTLQQPTAPEELNERTAIHQRLMELARRRLIKRALPGQRGGEGESKKLPKAERIRIARELAVLAQLPRQGGEGWEYLDDFTQFPEERLNLVLEWQSYLNSFLEFDPSEELKHRIEIDRLRLAASALYQQVSQLDEYEKYERNRDEQLQLQWQLQQTSEEQPRAQLQDQLKLLELQQEQAPPEFKSAWEAYQEAAKKVDQATQQYWEATAASQAQLRTSLERRELGAFTPILAEIAQLACKELANLVLEDLNPETLGMVVLQPDMYDRDFDSVSKQFETLDCPFGNLARQEFEKTKELADVYKNEPLEKLVKLAFKDSAAKATGLLSFGTGLTGRTFPDVAKLLLAQRALDQSQETDIRGGSSDHSLRVPTDPRKLKKLAFEKLIERSLPSDRFALSDADDARQAREILEKLYRRQPESQTGSGIELLTADIAEFHVKLFNESTLARLAVAKFGPSSSASDKLISTLMFGKYGPLERGSLREAKAKLSASVMLPKIVFILLLGGVILLGCWLTVDVNMTSIHGLYRDRLASAFLVGQNTKGDIDIEQDLDLEEICRYEARSKAPYHLINVALNLQGSKDIGIRDRNSDFFIFSKRFIGGERTGYCRSETLEQVFPQVSLATAMAISAAAASPNMGRGTSPLLVAFMTILNIRLGYWVPNPGLLEEQLDPARWKQRKKDQKLAKRNEPSRERDEAADRASKPLGYTFEEVFAQELKEIERRWEEVYPQGSPRHRHSIEKVAKAQHGARTRQAPATYSVEIQRPTVEHGLVGIGYSGGGIRSSTINLGITQTLHKYGIFDHIDYMSTVSGGGYLGASISTLMRSRTKLTSEVAGIVRIDKCVSEIDGTVELKTDPENSEKIIVVTSDTEAVKEYRFSCDAKLAVEEGARVNQGDALIEHRSETLEPIIGDQVVTVKPGYGEPRDYWFSLDAALNVSNKQAVPAGRSLLKPRTSKGVSEITGTVSVDPVDGAPTKQSVQTVRAQDMHGGPTIEYQFSRFEKLAVKTGDTVKPDQPLIQRHNTFGERFSWRVRPIAFLREMTSALHENYPWVNVSDGGHLENLATIELLRRRCKFIIVGDGEADPKLHFFGLATLMRTAYIDLGIKIKLDLHDLRLRKVHEEDEEPTISKEHWAIGKIIYPATGEHAKEEGYLLYLKSSFTGDEIEVIQEYRHRNPSFPHQSTADQFFDEGQFEAYRALGQHIAERALPSGNFRLMTNVDESKIPNKKSLVLVAKNSVAVKGNVAKKDKDVGKEVELTFYIYDANGQLVVKKHERELASRDEDLQILKRRLEPLWKSGDLDQAVSEMSLSEKANTIDAVRSLVGHPKMSYQELEAWLTGLHKAAEQRTSERNAAEKEPKQEDA